MINLNGNITEQSQIDFFNRGLFYGDSVFETIRCHLGTPLFYEAHYFRLMSSMRILRMDIPESFTPEYLEDQIKATLAADQLEAREARIRITVWRSFGGYYTPTSRTVEFAIHAEKLAADHYMMDDRFRESELFKDHYVTPGLLGTVKHNNRAVNVLAGIYAKENDYADMILLNEKKMLVEAISGNIFLRHGNTISTPAKTDGCLDGIMRGQVIDQIKRMIDLKVEERSITPFEIQRADEVFTTNVIRGLTPIHKYRKKEFVTESAEKITQRLNDLLF